MQPHAMHKNNSVFPTFYSYAPTWFIAERHTRRAGACISNTRNTKHGRVYNVRLPESKFSFVDRTLCTTEYIVLRIFANALQAPTCSAGCIRCSITRNGRNINPSTTVMHTQGYDCITAYLVTLRGLVFYPRWGPFVCSSS